jgi:hypothetical protein
LSLILAATDVGIGKNLKLRIMGAVAEPGTNRVPLALVSEIPVGQITKIKGEVIIERPNRSSRRAEQGDVIEDGDILILKEGASALVICTDKSRSPYQLGNNSFWPARNCRKTPRMRGLGPLSVEDSSPELLSPPLPPASSFRLPPASPAFAGGSTRPETRVARRRNSYVVVIPGNKLPEVSAVPGFSSATLVDDRRGQYVKAGTFSDRASAESTSALLRSYSFDARVVSFPSQLEVMQRMGSDR